MQVFVVSHIEKTNEGPVMQEQAVYGGRENAEAHFLTLCKRGLLNEDEFTQEMADEILDDGYYEDSGNYITISEETVI